MDIASLDNEQAKRRITGEEDLLFANISRIYATFARAAQVIDCNTSQRISHLISGGTGLFIKSWSQSMVVAYSSSPRSENGKSFDPSDYHSLP